MKNLIAILALILIIDSAWSQTLDYSNYEMVFCEPFNYQSNSTFPSHDFKETTGPNIPVSLSGSTVGDHAWEYWDFQNGNWGGRVRYKENYAFLASPGIMRLTQQKLQTPYQDNGDWVYYEAGYLKLRGKEMRDKNDRSRNYGYGIFEASIYFPDLITTQGIKNCPISFWLAGWSPTEIDVFDVSFRNFYVNRIIDWSYSPTHVWDRQGPNLTSGFHTFSAEWTPSIVRFYIDGVEINSVSYETVRTYPNFYNLEIAIMPYENLDYGSGQFMDIDWVKIWYAKCDESDLIITEPHGIEPFYRPHPQSGRLFRHKNVNISSASLLTLKQSVPTVINAEATTITSTFIADQSVFTTTTVNLGDANNPKWVTRNSNAFFEITPVVCESVSEIECNDDPPASKPGRKLKDTNTLMLVNEPLRRTLDSKSNAPYQQNNKNKALNNTIANIHIYPNPTTGSLNIEMPQKGNYTIRVMNMLGSTVYEGKMTDEHKKSILLDNNLPPGNYTLHISGDGLRHVERITLTK